VVAALAEKKGEGAPADTPAEAPAAA